MLRPGFFIGLLMGIMAFASASENSDSSCKESTERIGVLYAVHGGADTWGDQANFDSAVQIFSYDPNSFVHKVMWMPQWWPRLVGSPNAIRQARKYDFEYKRIGGTDPFDKITEAQLEAMSHTLKDLVKEHNEKSKKQIEIFTGLMSWVSSVPAHLPDPRSIYNPQVAGGTKMTYCGGSPPWPNCDPERYNVDGAVERMLANNVHRIVIVDTTTTGVRFFKTYDQLTATRRVVDAYNLEHGTDVKVEWVNDPTNLMVDSYPTEPEGWTSSLGKPKNDPKVPLDGRPNPFVEDDGLAALYVTGVKSQLRTDIPYAKQAIILVNHHVRRHNQYFDPKIDDTLVLNANIRKLLSKEFPGLKTKDILGAWMGVKEINAKTDSQKRERTREMRAEALGEAFLYETDEEMPGDLDGYLYWEALAKLKSKNRIEHIVIVFPQIFANSVLDLVEVPNQIAKEIGYKSWLHWGAGDYKTYPGVGHPFAEHWQFPNTQCRKPGSTDGPKTEPCCFKMEGCRETGQPYPPERQTEITEAIDDLDPHLGFDVPAYGHLGYDPSRGIPNDDAPVQSQYTGTWAMWVPPNDNPAAGEYIAKKVWEHIDPLTIARQCVGRTSATQIE